MASLCRARCLLVLVAAAGSRVATPPPMSDPLATARKKIVDGGVGARAKAAQMQARIEGVPSQLQHFLDKSLRRKKIVGKDVKADCKDVKEVYSFIADATSSNPDWELKVTKGKVRVWTRAVPGTRLKEVRGSGVLDAPPAVVLSLLFETDADVIRTYNPLYDSGHDVCQIDARTRLSYACVRPIFPFKPRDTLTRVAKWELPLLGKGATVLLLKHATHPDAPLYPKYVRAKIHRGMNLVQPVKGNPSKTNFTFTQQVDGGGVVPPAIMNVLTTQDSVQFVDRIGKAANRRHMSK